ncbi:MAG: HEAT repeat domain-containing protein [Planctomycetota bacterium]|jgi:HEAT repeat protein
MRAKGLSDPVFSATDSAASLLRKIKDPRAIKPLIRALRDKDEDVQYLALSALREITGEDFGKNRSEWQNWWRKNKDKFQSLIAYFH